MRTAVSGKKSCTPKSAASSTASSAAEVEVADQQRGQQRLRRGEQQLLGLPLVERQADASAARRPRRRSAARRPAASTGSPSRRSARRGRRAPRCRQREQHRDHELGRLRGERRHPLHQQELVDVVVPCRCGRDLPRRAPPRRRWRRPRVEQERRHDRAGALRCRRARRSGGRPEPAPTSWVLPLHRRARRTRRRSRAARRRRRGRS